MSHFKFGSQYKNIVKKYQEDNAVEEEKVLEQRDELINAIVNIGSTDNEKKAGGAGTAVMVRTEAYNKWLVEQQKRNPFIGKSYMMMADEYSRDSEEVNGAKAMTDQDAAMALEIGDDGSLHISEDYDPNNAEETDNEKLVGDAAKFADLCIINNVISRQLSWDFDSLMEEVSDELKKFHFDEADFELPENLDEQVDAALKRHEAMQLLPRYQEPPKK